MTKESAKDFIPLVQALADGKTIQGADYMGNWCDLTNPCFNDDVKLYRIKPEEPQSQYVESIEELKETVSRAGYRIAELKHEIDELKEHCKAVDEVNEKMKCCGNCSHRLEGTRYKCTAEFWWDKCDRWELAE